MNKKQEIENLKIELTKSQELIAGVVTRIDQLESECKVEAGCRYKPEINELYYCVTTLGDVTCSRWGNSNGDNHHYKMRNVFRTKEEAIFKRDRDLALADVNDIIEEENGDYIADWDKHAQDKYALSYNHSAKALTLSWWTCFQTASELSYVSKDAVEAVLSRITQEQINLIFRLGDV